MSLLTELLAKREQFITTDYAFKSNVDKNRLQLLACVRLVAKQHHPFFGEAQLKTALLALQQDKSYSINQRFLLLQLYAVTHDNAALIVKWLYQDETNVLHSLASKLALIMKVDDVPLSVEYSQATFKSERSGHIWTLSRSQDELIQNTKIVSYSSDFITLNTSH